MPRARATCPLTASTLATPPYAYPDPSENFGERSRRLINERAAIAVSTDENRMDVVEERPSEAEQPPHKDNFLDEVFYIKLKATLEVIFVTGWGVFIQNTSSTSWMNALPSSKKVKM